jgi:hypothetical protein
MVRHHRAMSGTIPSMETLHDDLKDNTIIVGRCPLTPLVSHTPGLLSLVLGASGDLAKKKVSSFPFHMVTGLKCLLDNSCTFWPLSLGSPSSRLQDRGIRQNEDGSG